MTPDTLVGGMSGAETVLFWIVAPVMVIAASALLFAKRAVVAAVCVVVTMIGLAVCYIALDAPFLGVAQVVVYTGAVMMLFVFVIMLVGVDVADSFRETIRGQRAAAIVFGVGLAAVTVGAILKAKLPEPVGIAEPDDGGNPAAVAEIVFRDYPFTLELVGTLLVVAALGAVVLTHRTRLTGRRSQRELAAERVLAGSQVTPLPAPGVYAGSNAADVPALDATGAAITNSVPGSIRARGQARSIAAAARPALAAAPPAATGPPELDAPAPSAEPDPPPPAAPDPPPEPEEGDQP